ncbi:Solute carrier family 22 member 2 [Holothuria leucospilota]|uniref:Solute carrier family 22 member 2 n=1 Tax=Holothuria leucospilota TaxID=206669 RepID=A0A9Q0YQC8_HOLLE|nr:Solute carrier family 22 member 2 [Holothuria leucospilota]
MINHILIFLAPGSAKIVIGMIGKSAISGAFGCTCIFTAELYPTLMRGMALGTCSLASWVGGILCPFILILAKTWAPLPLVLFSAASFIASALITFLPETKGTNLPETMAEAEQLSKRQQRKQTVDKDEIF